MIKWDFLGNNDIFSKVFDVYAALNDERKMHDTGGSGEPLSKYNLNAIDKQTPISNRHNSKNLRRS